MSDLFNSWGPWAWVALAWAQLFITYGGYQLYLRRRVGGLENKRLEDALSND